MNNIGKIVVAAIVILLIAAGIYYMRSSKTAAPASGLAVENFDTSAGGSDNQEFLRVLKNLQNVTLDPGVLNDDAFKSLVDFGVELNPEPTGRLNPFKPINPLELDLAKFQATST